MTGLFYAHSGLRYLVLLVAVVALAYYAYGLATRRPFDRPANLLRTLFVITIDIQVLLGLTLVLMGIWYPMLAGHLGLMVIALLVAHGSSVLAKRGADDRRRYLVMLVGVALTLLLIVGGILAIGRPILGSGRMTLGG